MFVNVVVGTVVKRTKTWGVGVGGGTLAHGWFTLSPVTLKRKKKKKATKARCSFK